MYYINTQCINSGYKQSVLLIFTKERSGTKFGRDTE